MKELSKEPWLLVMMKALDLGKNDKQGCYPVMYILQFL